MVDVCGCGDLGHWEDSSWQLSEERINACGR